MGKRLHFNLHTNRGLSDEQLSFLEAEWMELCNIEEYTTPWNSFEALAIIEQRFPDSRRVIEEIDRFGQRNRRVSA